MERISLPNKLYHGSSLPNLKVLTPSKTPLIKIPVLFATDDRRFALSMIHGTGEELAVGYQVNTKTGVTVFYIKELRKGAFTHLAYPGYLYEVSSEGFYRPEEKELALHEWIKDAEAKVQNVEYIENVLEALQTTNTLLCYYENLSPVHGTI